MCACVSVCEHSACHWLETGESAFTPLLSHTPAYVLTHTHISDTHTSTHLHCLCIQCALYCGAAAYMKVETLQSEYGPYYLSINPSVKIILLTFNNLFLTIIKTHKNVYLIIYESMLVQTDLTFTRLTNRPHLLHSSC